MGLFSWLRLQSLDGVRRKYYSVPLILICMCVAASTAAGVSILTTLWLRSDTGNRIYTQDVRACARQNGVRRESNQRIGPHIIDRDDLALLSKTLAHTRILERGAFEALGRVFHIERQVRPLLRVYRHAARVDAMIARRQQRVTFRPLAIVDCKAPGIVIHP